MAILDGKVVMISGTAGGQGRAAALLFAKAGAKVFACDVNAEGAAETVEMVRAEGGIIESLAPLDPSDPVQAERWAKATVDAFDRLLHSDRGTQPGVKSLSGASRAPHAQPIPVLG